MTRLDVAVVAGAVAIIAIQFAFLASMMGLALVRSLPGLVRSLPMIGHVAPHCTGYLRLAEDHDGRTACMEPGTPLHRAARATLTACLTPLEPHART